MEPEIKRAASGCSTTVAQPLNGREWTAACEAFANAVRERRVRHLGDVLLLDAIEGGNPDVARISRAIDGLVMGTASYLPYGAEQLVLYRGPQLTGVYVQQALGGQYDLVNIGKVQTASP